jgi:CubicO group peptidase (beta-lactamase class C family)
MEYAQVVSFGIILAVSVLIVIFRKTCRGGSGDGSKSGDESSKCGSMLYEPKSILSDAYGGYPSPQFSYDQQSNATKDAYPPPSLIKFRDPSTNLSQPIESTVPVAVMLFRPSLNSTMQPEYNPMKFGKGPAVLKTSGPLMNASPNAISTVYNPLTRPIVKMMATHIHTIRNDCGIQRILGSFEQSTQVKEYIARGVNSLSSSGSSDTVPLIACQKNEFTINDPSAHPGTPDSFTENDACWPIGSVSKSFTATLMLQLVEQEMLPPMSTTIDRWIEDGPNHRTSKITLTMLANMTSGLADYEEEMTRIDPLIQRNWTPQELVMMAFSQPPQFAPGTGWKYCNTGYIIMGLIMCHEMKEPSLNVLLQKYILRPFGLHHTSMSENNNTLPYPFITGFSDIGDGKGMREALGLNRSWAWAAGGMISTCADLHRWTRIFGTGAAFHAHAGPMSTAKIINSAGSSSSAQFTTPQLNDASSVFLPFHKTFFYGYGLLEDNGWIWHNGELPGWMSAAAYHPQYDLSVVLVCNQAPTDTKVQARYGENAVTHLLRLCIKDLTPNNQLNSTSSHGD